MYIYRIFNNFNNKCYIGLDSKPSTRLTRWKQHLQNYDKKHPYVSKLYKAMLKYGKECFDVEILLECNNREELLIKEAEYIQKFNSIKNGYNVLPADLCFSVPLSEEDLERIKTYKSVGSKKANMRRWNKLNEEERRRFFEKHLKTSKEERSIRTKKYYDNLSEEEKIIRNASHKWTGNIERRKKAAQINGLKALKFAEPYNIYSPDGESFIEVYGIKRFCKHRNLNAYFLKRVADGALIDYNGWRAEYFDETKRVPYTIKKRPVYRGKTYNFTSPLNEKVEINNLTHFCRENKLSVGGMKLVYKGLQKEHNGWKKYET